jgi:hypothetical protein
MAEQNIFPASLASGLMPILARTRPEAGFLTL